MKHIVILDDDTTILTVAEAILSVLCTDVIVHYFNDVLDLMELLDEQKIDALITDLMFPNTDGERIADYCRKKNPALRVWIMSGFLPERVLRYPFIQKPVAFKELADFINQIKSE